MLFGVAMFPIGAGCSLTHPVAEVVDEIRRSGLEHQVTAMETVIEGDWDDVMPVIQRAEARLRAAHDRVFMVITMDDHASARGRLRGAVEDVERELDRAATH